MEARVSVIICCYDEDNDILARALNSVQTQRYGNLEVFVIDDSGKDRFKNLVEKQFADFSYISCNFRNNANALNMGISKCSGSYVAILDGDDQWIDDHKISKQAAFLEKNREYVVVGTWIEIEFPDGTRARPVYNSLMLANRDNLISHNPICHSSVVMRRSSLEKISEINRSKSIMGVYDPAFRRGKDWELMLQLATIGKITLLEDISVRYYQNQVGKRWYDSLSCIRVILKHRKSYRRWPCAMATQIVRFVVFFLLEKVFRYNKP